MINPSTLRAMVQLLDDPDLDVSVAVENRLMEEGESVIDELEALWLNNEFPDSSRYIELVINKIQSANNKNLGLIKKYILFKKLNIIKVIKMLKIGKYQGETWPLFVNLPKIISNDKEINAKCMKIINKSFCIKS